MWRTDTLSRVCWGVQRAEMFGLDVSISFTRHFYIKWPSGDTEKGHMRGVGMDSAYGGMLIKGPTQIFKGLYIRSYRKYSNLNSVFEGFRFFE